MTRKEQRAFVRSLTRAVCKHLLATSDRWPEEWDGHELRELIAGSFNRERYFVMRKGRRAREFRNTILTTPINH